MRLHARGIFAGLQNFELFAIPPSHRQGHYTESWGWWRDFEWSRLLCVPTAPVFDNYSRYILKHHPLHYLVWRSATSELMVYTFISLVRMGCTGTRASNSGHSRVLSVKKGKLVSLPSLLRGHNEQYCVLELQCDSCFDMNLGFIAYSRSREVLGVASSRRGSLTISIWGC